MVLAQREQADRIFIQRLPRGDCPDLPHIARQLGHDVAVPRGTASMRNLSQRPTEASSRPVTPDRRKVGLEVSSIDSVTLSDRESRENAPRLGPVGVCGGARRPARVDSLAARVIHYALVRGA